MRAYELENEAQGTLFWYQRMGLWFGGSIYSVSTPQSIHVLVTYIDDDGSLTEAELYPDEEVEVTRPNGWVDWNEA